MKISGKHRYTFLCAGIAMSAFGIAMTPIAGYAQGAYQSPAGQPGPDADLAARVQQALQADPTLNARHIDVAVDHGTVVLKGFVETQRSLLAAQQVATKAAGNHKVLNQIIIKQNYPNAP